MKTIFPTSRCHAFTLVELLTVIAIIAILAAMLLPVLSRVRLTAQKTQAKLQIQDLVTAIQKYDSDYGRFPVSPGVQAAAGTGDFTYLGSITADTTNFSPAAFANYATNNSEVIAILMDITNTSVTPVNMNHQKNPQQTIFLNAKMTGDTNTWPGVGPDLVYRDPWGNPYVITMDLNYDEQCADAVYHLSKVSDASGGLNKNPGFNGLINPNGTPDNYQYHGKVMVWSVGPDKRANPSLFATGPLSGVNKDNILSWQ